MAAFLKSAMTYSMPVLCTLIIIMVYYITSVRQGTIANLFPIRIKLLPHIHEFHESSMKAYLPVLYLTDVAARDRAKLLKNVTSRRKTPLKSLNVIGKMMENRYHDDYRFCRKEAPFVGPYNYISNSKSPCWYSENRHLRCIPYFYLVGFSKSGTTDLFNRITSHPEISKRTKEIHWLDYIRYFQDRDSINTYASTFSKPTKEIEEKIRATGDSDIVFGDGTPCYVWDSLYWPCYEGNRGLTEPKYTNADVIYRLNPQAKIIITLRDPVTRLYSRYLMRINRTKMAGYKNPSPNHFHTITTRAINLYTKCFKEWSHRHCAYNGTVYVQSKSRLLEGVYSIYIRDWLKVFPRNQIFIMKFEDYVTDIPGYLHRIYRFLDISSLSDNKVKKISQLKARNTGHHYNIGPIMEETKEMLQKFYAPFNKDLQNLLNDTSWAWGYE